ncbi:DUF4181 domain-containing protein [Rossellomorea sp. NPDC071047]|uniref:DUF4181 domain-containing protein n=1 Tax=Rossellomorea sp. NPDC071047 TaxID=3390675 RepID=UPI003D032896
MFWVKFSLMAIIVFCLISMVKFLLRKIFKIEKVKRKFFSNNHINESHRKVDKWVRILTAITLMVLAIMMMNNEDLTYLYILGFTTLSALDYAVKAFFEWKSSEYPKQAILTLAEMFLVLMKQGDGSAASFTNIMSFRCRY